MNQEQYESLEILKYQEGWKLYLEMLKTRFDVEYKKLRNFKQDVSIERINGVLDGLEYAIKLLTNEIEEYRRQITQAE